MNNDFEDQMDVLANNGTQQPANGQNARRVGDAQSNAQMLKNQAVYNAMIAQTLGAGAVNQSPCKVTVENPLVKKQ
jgi:uncharacterized membrane protein